MKLIYEGTAGEHIETSAKNAIKFAKRTHEYVYMKFNDIEVRVFHMMSVSDVVSEWNRVFDQRQKEWEESPEGKREKSERAEHIRGSNRKMRWLMRNRPSSKEGAMEWLARWIPLADTVDVESHAADVAVMLRSIGFRSAEHVGDPEFETKTASKQKTIEYIGGQVISMIESIGLVHPMIAQWAKEQA